MRFLIRIKSILFLYIWNRVRRTYMCMHYICGCRGQSDDSGRFMNSPFRSKKVSVPPNAISRVIGRGGSNINAIRGATGAHIEVEKQSKCQGERIITIK
jgi:predicted RNA-binding protein YlqC (UPF0109 family)